MCDNATGTYNTIIADGNTRQYTDLRTDPHIIAYGNWPCILQSTIPRTYIKRMPRRIEATIRSHKNIIAKSDRCTVENNTIHISVKILTKRYIITVVTIEGLLYQKGLSGTPQQTT